MSTATSVIVAWPRFSAARRGPKHCARFRPAPTGVCVTLTASPRPTAATARLRNRKPATPSTASEAAHGLEATRRTARDRVPTALPVWSAR